MNIKEKKRKIRKLKFKMCFQLFIRSICMYKIHFFLVIIILLLLFLSYYFSANTFININKTEYFCNLSLSLFTSLSTGYALYIFLNFNSKYVSKIKDLEFYVNKIENKVFELLNIIESILNSSANNCIYNKFNIKIGTWFVDFTSLRSQAFYAENKKLYQRFVNIIDYKYADLKKEYSIVIDDKTLLKFCKKK